MKSTHGMRNTRIKLERETFIVAAVMIEVFFYSFARKTGQQKICSGSGCQRVACKWIRLWVKEEKNMLGNILLIWILVSVFVGKREANRMFRMLLGLFIGFWVFRMVAGFGFALLPLIGLIWLGSEVVIPFVKGFLHS